MFAFSSWPCAMFLRLLLKLLGWSRLLDCRKPTLRMSNPPMMTSVMNRTENAAPLASTARLGPGAGLTIATFVRLMFAFGSVGFHVNEPAIRAFAMHATENWPIAAGAVTSSV